MKTTKFDCAKHLTSSEAQAELVSDALKSGDAAFIANALRTVNRANELGRDRSVRSGDGDQKSDFTTTQTPDDIASHKAGEEGV